MNNKKILRSKIFFIGITFFIMANILVITAMALESSKVFVLKLNYDDGKLALIDKAIKFGYAPDRKSIDEGYKLEILDDAGDMIYTTNFELPLIEYIESANSTTGELSGEVIRYEKIDFTLVVPYFESADKIEIYNKNKFRIVEVELKKKDYGIFLWVVMGFLILIIIFVFGRKKRKGKGLKI